MCLFHNSTFFNLFSTSPYQDISGRCSNNITANCTEFISIICKHYFRETAVSVPLTSKLNNIKFRKEKHNLNGLIDQFCLFKKYLRLILHRKTISAQSICCAIIPQPKLHSTVYGYVRFEVFTAVTMKNGVFWDVTPCGSCNNQHFGGT
jgi:hypothetical protein